MNQATPAIHVGDLRKRFRTTQALDGVSLDIQQGEFFGLLGPNGAGKTTLIYILAGLTRADSGQAAILGHDVVRDYRKSRRALGVVPQELVYDPFFNVRETLRIQSGYFGLRHNDSWIDEIMLHLDLTAKADANMRTLSGGMKRRVLVAQALVHRPPVHRARRADGGGGTLLLIERGRLHVDVAAEAWVREALAQAPVEEAPVTTEVVFASRALATRHRDPVDRFLAATAQVFGLTLVTADHELALVPGIRALRNQRARRRRQPRPRSPRSPRRTSSAPGED